MIRFKVIKLENQRYLILIGILLFIIFFLKANWSISVEPVFNQVSKADEKIDKNNIKKNETIFGYLDKDVKKRLKFLNKQLIEEMLTWSVPAMNVSNEKSSKSFTINDTVNHLLYLATNIDFSTPESLFCVEIPAAKILKTEMTMTPGVEIISEEESEYMPKNSSTTKDLYSDIEKINKLDKDPLVLIFHTHTTESYTPSNKFRYKLKDKSYHTENLNYTVANVGEHLAKELNNLEIPTIHNKTVHDVPTYMTSYGNSLKTVRKILKEKPSIEVVIDLHRDAPVKSSKKSREITTVKIDGKTYSRVMFVVGSDKTFPHPHWKENYKFCTLLNKELEKKYPGISRGIDVRKERFNQHLSKKAILIEIGSHGNTMEESIETAKILAQVIADVLKELSKK